MGLFRRTPKVDPVAIDALHRELVELRARLENSDMARTAIENKLGELDVTISTLDATTSALVAAASALTVRTDALGNQNGQLDELMARVANLGDQISSVNVTDEEARSQLTELAERLAATADDVRIARDQAATIDARVSNVATELANQLGELSRELDVLVERTATSTDSVVIEQLRVGQVKLASEQARYEIAFRQDLAALADSLRRGRNGDH